MTEQITDRQFIGNITVELGYAWNNLTRGKTQETLKIIDEVRKSCLARLYFDSREEYDEYVKKWGVDSKEENE